ncbi:MAG: GNAT family N-acetyltransferase [Marinilabiliales bacterium]|nr:MAG: GNAT family N-acetyltransferase [Marinilabiliales bacterium]
MYNYYQKTKHHMNDFIIRKLNRDEMKTAIAWADKEGWNPGVHDEECFYNADPNGFFALLVNDKIVSIISAVKYDNNYGFIGFYIVDPEHRGKGYGIAIWQKAMEYLNGKVIGLDGVPEQVENYKKSGFVYAHRNITYKGISKTTSVVKQLKDLNSNDFSMIKNFDIKYMPDTRDSFLKCWLSQDDSHIIGIEENGKLRAYGKIRKCYEGYKIGPVFAETDELASSIFYGLQNKIPETSEFTIDIPEGNEFSLNMAKSCSMEYFFETARMYKGEIKKLPINNIYGITTYELG